MLVGSSDPLTRRSSSQEHVLAQPRAYYRVEQSAEPDLWLDAVQVWEVKCADLSLSPVYKAAMGLVGNVWVLLLGQGSCKLTHPSVPRWIQKRAFL